jgi:hypothetical protein
MAEMTSTHFLALTLAGKRRAQARRLAQQLDGAALNLSTPGAISLKAHFPPRIRSWTVTPRLGTIAACPDAATRAE